MLHFLRRSVYAIHLQRVQPYSFPFRLNLIDLLHEPPKHPCYSMLDPMLMKLRDQSFLKKSQEPESFLVIGGRGDAKVTAERITVGKRLYRYFAQTFRLPM